MSCNQWYIGNYHIYKEIWCAVFQHCLCCQQETGIPHCLYIVAVMERSVIVGYVPREISAVPFFRDVMYVKCLVEGVTRWLGDTVSIKYKSCSSWLAILA